MEKLSLETLTNIPVIELDEIYLRALREEAYLDMF